MKRAKFLITAFIGLSLISACSGNETQEVKGESEKEEKVDPKAFNPELAKELGADDYGMHFYVMAFLKMGPNRDQDSATAANLQRAHLDNITRLANERKLVVAGPFMDDGDLRGIYIFDVKTVKEAEELVKTDPAIKAGRLVMELHPWYGSAALIKSAEIHGTIAKQKI